MKEDEKVKQFLGNHDPIEFWIKEANNYFQTIKDQSIKCTEAISIITNSFGEEWLNSRIAELSDKSPPFSSPHPVASWITTPGYNQVVSCLELAKYIKCTYSFPRFNDVLTIMKTTEQFDTGFNQIAFACKLKEIGAINIEFEPPTENGRVSDIQCEYSGQTYILESYVPATNAKPWYQDIITISANKAYDISRGVKKRIILHIHLKCSEDNWDGKKRKFLEQKIWEGINNLQGSEVSIKNEDFNLKIYDTTFLDIEKEESLFNEVGKNSLCGINFGTVKTEDTLEIMRGQKVESSPEGRVFLELDDLHGSVEETVGKLAEKLKSKISQTRKGDAKGVLLVQQPFLGDEKQLQISLERIRKKLFPKYEKLAGAFIMRRAFKRGCMPFYTGNVLINNENNPELLQKLIENEWKIYNV